MRRSSRGRRGRQPAELRGKTSPPRCAPGDRSTAPPPFRSRCASHREGALIRRLVRWRCRCRRPGSLRRPTSCVPLEGTRFAGSTRKSSQLRPLRCRTSARRRYRRRHPCLARPLSSTLPTRSSALRCGFGDAPPTMPCRRVLRSLRRPARREGPALTPSPRPRRAALAMRPLALLSSASPSRYVGRVETPA